MPRTNYSNMIEIDDLFTQRVYDEVAKIPAGHISTYGKIAELAGYERASREVGVVMSRVPGGMDLPCHRVVNKNGTLAPNFAFGGKEKQRAMLEAEGITFSPEGVICMGRHMWPKDSEVEQLSLF